MRVCNVNVRRYFDRKNGNTYHTVNLTLVGNDGKVSSVQSPFEYGYGDAWKTTAGEAVNRIGLNVDGPSGYRYFREGISQGASHVADVIICEVVDVSRQKDLHNVNRTWTVNGKGEV